jgi:hypothetical protein
VCVLHVCCRRHPPLRKERKAVINPSQLTRLLGLTGDSDSLAPYVGSLALLSGL